MKDRTVDDFVLETNREMLNFFQRSVQQNTATGIPKSFDLQVELTQLKGEPVRDRYIPKAITYPQGGHAPPSPTVTSVVPARGSYSGKSQVTIHGDNFILSSDYQAVFNGVSVAATKVNNTTLTCTVPPGPLNGYGPPGRQLLVDVKVIASTGQEGTLTNGYAYFVGALIATPRTITVPHGTFPFIDITSLDDFGVFDPTDYDLCQLELSLTDPTVNITLWSVNPNPTEMFAGHRTVQVSAILANPGVDGILNLTYRTRFGISGGTGITFFTLNMTH